MRYELGDFEWAAIKPLLPNKSRGVRRVNNRRVLMASFGSGFRRTMARSAGLLWPPHHLLQSFVRWRRAGVWSRIIDLLPPLMMRPSK